jgi:predicted regulator of Ras-like GTPase activity (Roadblock/LC7/MglB family)
MALVGNLKDLKLPSLIQLNCMERNTAKLTIETEGKYGFIYFEKGQVVHAEFDPEIGDKAVYRLLGLYSGLFKVESGIRPPVKSIKTSWNNLLLDGLNQIDVAEDNPERKFAHIFERLFAVKGIKSAIFLDDEGEIVASSSENLKDKNFLFALSVLQAEKVGAIFNKGYPDFTSISSGSDRYILARNSNLNLIMLLDSKMKLDVILPFLRQALAQ